MQQLRLQALRWAVQVTQGDTPECLDQALNLGLQPEYLRAWSPARRTLEDTPEGLLLAVCLRVYEIQRTLPTAVLLTDWAEQQLRGGRLSQERFEAIVGILHALPHLVCAPSEVAAVVNRLREDYLRHLGARGIIELAETTLPHAPIPEVSAHLRQLANELDASDRTEQAGIYTLAEIADERWQQYLVAEHDDHVGRGYQTGWLEFDKRNNGVKPGEVMVVAANSSVGKSAFQLRTALNLWRCDGRRVMLVNREMTNTMQHGRMEAMELAQVLGDDPTIEHLATRIQTGELNEKEREIYRQVLDTYKHYDVPFWVVSPDAYRDLDDLAATVSRYCRQYGLEVLCADSLNLQRVGGGHGDRHDLQMGANVQRMADIAKTNNIAVLTDCQSPQQVATKVRCTKEQAVGYSQQILHGSDVLIRLYPTSDWELEAQVLKARSGEANYSFNLYFDRSNMRMEYAGP